MGKRQGVHRGLGSLEGGRLDDQRGREPVGVALRHDEELHDQHLYATERNGSLIVTTGSSVPPSPSITSASDGGINAAPSKTRPVVDQHI